VSTAPRRASGAPTSAWFHKKPYANVRLETEEKKEGR
jgi:hypothetical protein